MAKRLEERLAAIDRIGAAPSEPELTELRQALRGKTGLLVAAAAKVVGEHAIDALIEELPAAFERLLERPIERDPGCRGKSQIARTLLQLERWFTVVFARGVSHVQREPIWGGTEDTAAELRGLSGLAHAQLGRHDALEVLARLLADTERISRSAAAQALGDSGRPDAIPLLRYKAIIGDDEPAVFAACLASLLALAPDDSLTFVADFLELDPDRAGVAALALGESRREAAFPILRRWCEDRLGDERRVGYLALALLRLEPATAHLLAVIETEGADDARAAASALATFRDDPALGPRVHAATAGRDPSTRSEIRALFARPA